MVTLAQTFNPASLGDLWQRINSVPSGTTVADSARTGDSRVVQPGRAYDFDGTDDHVAATNTTITDYPFSFGGWVNPDVLGSNALFGMADASIDTRYMTLRINGAGGDLYIVRRNPTAVVTATGFRLTI